jgi:Tfp pilus assembly protein PilX
MSDLTQRKSDRAIPRARDEQGIALVAAIVLLTVIMGLGLGLLLFTDSQQKASAREQASESAFNLAEAALNAQVGQLSRRWPSTEKIGEEFPTCTSTTSTSTNGCPSTAGMNAGYPAAGSASCPAGTATEAWGSPLTNRWTTYVREDVGKSPNFNSTTERTAPVWDEHKAGKLWVRSVGVVQCHFVTLITLVSRQEVTVSFPENAATANWFETSNKGNKTIVNTKGPKASKSGKVSMRCNGFKNTEECEKWEKGKEQVSPDTTGAGGSPSPTLSATQLEALKQQAESAGTYYTAGKCPESPEAAAGLPAYVEGPCELSYTKGTGNTEESPGFLVLVNGTLTLSGNSQYFGVVYAVNKQESSGIVVELHGCNRLVGAIDVDGNGGINFGSCAENFVYDPTAISKLKGSAGAAPTRNSFRVLPAGQ